MTHSISQSNRPRIALTLGDPAGIGPEVIVRAWDAALLDECEPIVVGHPVVLARACALVNSKLSVVEVESLDAGEAKANEIPCWNPGSESAMDVPLGRNDPRGGLAAYEALRGACWGALSGSVDAITTAPLSKASLHLAGFDYPGHTEILADMCQVSSHAMMLYLARENGGGIAVAHVTLHTSIRSVPDLLSISRIDSTIDLIGGFLKQIGFQQPRIGVCALNPHAGEEGLFGDEESTLIAPAVATSASRGWTVTGPFPADTLFKRANAGEFDGVVAMYHDQGHIAFKLLGFNHAVNITLGLPIVRTSPSHGTAYDIAGKGVASGQGMRAAIQTAAQLARRRQTAGNGQTAANEIE